MTGSARSGLDRTLERLASISEREYFNPYRHFRWPDRLPADSPWMPWELTTLFDSRTPDPLSEIERIRITQWECVNFFSLNVHGIRDLLLAVLEHVHTGAAAMSSRYVHHFIGEENEHMWFFAEFCLRYGGKIYPRRTVRLDRERRPDVDPFLAFARILIFEEIGDFFNIRFAEDEALPEIVREISRVHHREESRHIAFGRRLLEEMWRELQSDADEAARVYVDDHLRKHIQLILASLYNPAVYSDAGLADGVRLAHERMKSEERREFHARVVRGLDAFLREQEILTAPALA